MATALPTIAKLLVNSGVDLRIPRTKRNTCPIVAPAMSGSFAMTVAPPVP